MRYVLFLLLLVPLLFTSPAVIIEGLPEDDDFDNQLKVLQFTKSFTGQAGLSPKTVPLQPLTFDQIGLLTTWAVKAVVTGEIDEKQANAMVKIMNVRLQQLKMRPEHDRRRRDLWS